LLKQDRQEIKVLDTFIPMLVVVYPILINKKTHSLFWRCKRGSLETP